MTISNSSAVSVPNAFFMVSLPVYVLSTAYYNMGGLSILFTTLP